MTGLWQKYGKLITGILGMILTGLATSYSGAPWWPIVAAAASALGIYYAPHQVTTK